MTMLARRKRAPLPYMHTWEWDARECASVRDSCCPLPEEHDIHNPWYIVEESEFFWAAHEFQAAGPCGANSDYMLHSTPYHYRGEADDEAREDEARLRYGVTVDRDSRYHAYVRPADDDWDRLGSHELTRSFALWQENLMGRILRSARADRGLTQRAAIELIKSQGAEHGYSEWGVARLVGRLPGYERGASHIRSLRDLAVIEAIWGVRLDEYEEHAA